MDGLTRLLLTKYRPELLQEPTAVTKSEALPSQGSTVKSAAESLQEASGMVVIMSSNDYSESTIFKALREFNMANPQLTARSFTLPVGMNGIPAGSWVFVPSKED